MPFRDTHHGSLRRPRTTMLDNVNLEDLPPEVKEQIKEHTRLLEESKKTLGRFMGEVVRQDFEISRHQYYELLALKETLLYNRSIPNRRFLAYLLPLLTKEDLKNICREYHLDHFSKMRKDFFLFFSFGTY